MKWSRSLRKHSTWWVLILCLSALYPSASRPQDLKAITLPSPQTSGGRPLMQALKDRQSRREFSAEKLPLQVLANLLWAGFGVNRPGSGKRTAPSAVDWQETDIYVATADGLYVYDAKQNQLSPVARGDLRGQTGTQDFVKDAAVNLVYVADLAKAKRASADRDMFVAADVGFIAENVYLYCASEGLATVVRGSIDRPALAKAMHLRDDQRIVLAQSVGYPKK
jgi:nitroreductase